jgi:hypothetical protein
MKKDTQQRSGVSQGSTRAATIGDPAAASQARGQAFREPSTPRRLDGAPAAPSLTARYIDSRLKQFCLR